MDRNWSARKDWKVFVQKGNLGKKSLVDSGLIRDHEVDRVVKDENAVW